MLKINREIKDEEVVGHVTNNIYTGEIELEFKTEELEQEFIKKILKIIEDNEKYNLQLTNNY